MSDSCKRVVGVDGCPAGWLAIELSATRLERAEVLENIKTVWERFRGAGLILIDIPIGLPDKERPSRDCDILARKCIGPRWPSVFPTPARETLRASDYGEACVTNERHLGKRISKQLFNILKKIREVDDFLTGEQDCQGVIQECHPELCFWGLNNQRTLKHSKNVAAGLAERRTVLEASLKGMGSAFAEVTDTVILGMLDPKHQSRRSLSADDILDAMACAVAAWHTESLCTIPKSPVPVDREGLPMQMVYARPMNEFRSVIRT